LKPVSKSWLSDAAPLTINAASKSVASVGTPAKVLTTTKAGAGVVYTVDAPLAPAPAAVAALKAARAAAASAGRRLMEASA
jgi:hypothetical protein